MDLKILEIASNTENHKIVKNHTHLSKNKNPICGDEMKIYLVIDNKIILNFKYQCQSCIFCQASVSLLSSKTKGKAVEKVKILLDNVENFFGSKTKLKEKEWKDFEKILNKKYIARKECLLLPFKTMLKALNNEN